ncbi:hypothetical protein Pryu01_02477 [Paraliobacillus ryukyuensis]|uniref:Uncharacterized protein n=1 Tax=Paraliobacillus ryukyuensis TaxID=200904 RepID=A0A366DTW5_9BACI|nr:hypothetical protein [Paraliobacillus ryukyuensis]RBO93536.1 hypothetical protein DES48_11146 [Paraliobacillus ryukyuensis]
MKSKVTCKLFKLTKINSLIDVKKNILNRKYTDPLKIASRDSKKAEHLSEEEKNFYFTWGEVSQQNDISFYDINEQEDSVEYFFVPADIEFTKRKKKDSNGNFLSKANRVNYAQIMVYFFNIKDSVHLIICSSNEFHVDRVKKLVGTQYISKIDDDYQMPPDLFNWLFFKYTQNAGLLDDGITLMNISGFIGNIGDEHNIFSGTSDQTSELIITKAFISNGETLKTITARLRNADIDIVFTLDDMSNTQIFVNQSSKLKMFEAENNEPFFIVYLYSYLIPKLKSLYNNSAKHFLSEEKKQFRIQIGLEVIESIIKKNLLDLNDVAALFETSSTFDKKIEHK